MYNNTYNYNDDDDKHDIYNMIIMIIMLEFGIRADVYQPRFAPSPRLPVHAPGSTPAAILPTKQADQKKVFSKVPTRIIHLHCLLFKQKVLSIHNLLIITCNVTG